MNEKLNALSVINDFEEENNVKVIYLIKSGSQLYGTNTETSDTDYIGLFMPSITSVMLKKDPDHLVVTTGQANSKNSNDDVDIQLWSVYKFLNLIKKGETGAIDLLFSLKAKHKDEIQVINNITYTKVFMENFDSYLSRDLKAFVGYCLGQAKKYNIKGARFSELQDFLISFKKLHYFTTDTMKALEDGIKEIIEAYNFKYIRMVYAKGPKIQGNDFIWYLEILGRKHALDIEVGEFLNRMDRMLNSFGARTLAAANGVDNKALSHATRVILECEELLKIGHITFPLKDREFIKAIKYHKDLVQGDGMLSDKLELNLDNLMHFLELKLDKVNDLLENSELPDNVPESIIEESLRALIYQDYKLVTL